MIKLFVDSIGLIAPGMTGWSQACAILRGETPYAWQDVPLTTPAILSAAERRRCIASARLALSAAHQALEAVANGTPRQLACVFASSDGDSQVITHIMESLAQEIPDVSPTRFANSVHNAAAGYWSIATGMKQCSTCLSAFDESFAAGLLETAAQVADEGIDSLLTASDVHFQEPFFTLRPIAIDCAATLLLTRERTGHSLARLHIELVKQRPASAMPTWLPEAFASSPAARALPLLAALAAPDGQTICLDYLGQTLAVTVTAEAAASC
jgi:hypothetical protein